MALPIFEFQDFETYRVLAFRVPEHGVTSIPEFLQVLDQHRLELESLTQPLMIHGRGPIWAYGMLLATARQSSALGVYNPRLGFVIDQSSNSGFPIGQVIEKTTRPKTVMEIAFKLWRNSSVRIEV